MKFSSSVRFSGFMFGLYYIGDVCSITHPQINDAFSSLIVAQLLYLQSEDMRKPIHMYINSPGEARSSVATGPTHFAPSMVCTRLHRW